MDLFNLKQWLAPYCHLKFPLNEDSTGVKVECGVIGFQNKRAERNSCCSVDVIITKNVRMFLGLPNITNSCYFIISFIRRIVNDVRGRKKAVSKFQTRWTMVAQVFHIQNRARIACFCWLNGVVLFVWGCRWKVKWVSNYFSSNASQLSNWIRSIQ
jgi:hypothetical protein